MDQRLQPDRQPACEHRLGRPLLHCLCRTRPRRDRNFIQPHTRLRIRQPERLIVLADGVYMGRQSLTHLGDTNSRIGYRHSRGSNEPVANVLYADGHVAEIGGDNFPRAEGGSVTVQMAQQENENDGERRTVYANPITALGQ